MLNRENVRLTSMATSSFYIDTCSILFIIILIISNNKLIIIIIIKVGR